MSEINCSALARPAASSVESVTIRRRRRRRRRQRLRPDRRPLPRARRESWMSSLDCLPLDAPGSSIKKREFYTRQDESESRFATVEERESFHSSRTSSPIDLAGRVTSVCDACLAVCVHNERASLVSRATFRFALASGTARENE